MNLSSRRYQVALGTAEESAFVAERRSREFEHIVARAVERKKRASAKPSVFIRLVRAAGTAAAPCLVVAFALWFAREQNFELFSEVPLVGQYVSDVWIARLSVASVAIGSWIASG